MSTAAVAKIPPPDDPRRYVYFKGPRCPDPDCQSADVVAYKSMPPEADGSRGRYTVCRVCGARFIAVQE